MAIRWYDAAVDAVAALFDGGSIEIRSGSRPAENAALTGTVLATLTFAATAFGSSSGGTATAAAITDGTATGTDTAGYAAFRESDGTVIGTGTVGTSGADVNLNTLSIVSGANVSCSSFTLPGGS